MSLQHLSFLERQLCILPQEHILWEDRANNALGEISETAKIALTPLCSSPPIPVCSHQPLLSASLPKSLSDRLLQGRTCKCPEVKTRALPYPLSLSTGIWWEAGLGGKTLRMQGLTSPGKSTELGSSCGVNLCTSCPFFPAPLIPILLSNQDSKGGIVSPLLPLLTF